MKHAELNIKRIAAFVIKTYPDSCFAENAKNGYIDMNDDEMLTEELVRFFAYDILNLCGCGNPEDTWDVIRRVLRIRLEARDIAYAEMIQRYKDELHLDDDDDLQHGSLQFILYILDHFGLVEHGSSIGGCWLTDLGRMCLFVMDAWFALNPDGDTNCLL